MSQSSTLNSTLPEPIEDLTEALRNSGAHYVDVDFPESDHPNLVNVSFSTFSRFEHHPTRHNVAFCDVRGNQVAFDVKRIADAGRPDISIERGVGREQLMAVAESEVKGA